jgi:hypothetical protein
MFDKSVNYILSTDYALHKDENDSGQYLLFNIQTGKIFKLNKTSYYMLESFDGEASVDQIQSKLLIKYQGDENQIVGDFLSLTKQWVARGILVDGKGGEA